MSKTQENLLKAVAGESLARNKYSFFAIRARDEGYEGIARIFEETSGNEMEHAERELEFVENGAKTTTEVAVNPVSTTVENLKEAIAGEDHETSTMYPSFKDIAREEKLDEIADVFKEIGEVEEKHRDRYKEILAHVEAGTVFKRDKEIEWKCLNCGYIHKGTEAPEKCPTCAKPQAWYEPRSFNW